MRPTRRLGASNGELLLFLLLLGVGAMVCIYLSQNSKVVERTVVIEKDPSPPPTPAAPTPKPAPVMTPPPAQVRVPAGPPQLPEVVVVYTPPPPACIAIEKRLRIAEEAATQVNLEIAAAKKSALDRLRQTADYQSLRDDLLEKKKAKDDALIALKKDEDAGSDTEQDSASVRATSLAWVAQQAVLTHLEDQTVADDVTVAQQVQNLKEIQAEIVQEQRQLEDYIRHEISSVCANSACRIDDVKFDADRSIVQVDMTPANQASAGAMADAALNNVGMVLETLSKSAFKWEEIRFRVCGEATNLVEYQLTFAHSATTDVSFELLHINSLSYPPIHPSDLRIGTRGILFNVKIMNVIDRSNMIVWLDDSAADTDDSTPVWIRGISTAAKVDDSTCDITTPLVVTRTIQYKTVGAGLKTIYMLEPTGSEENLLIGDYYDNSKLVALAKNIWMNPDIDHLQGRPALPNTYIRQPGVQPPELYNTLQIGGYARDDGTQCPLTLVHSPHPVSPAQPNPPANTTPPLPGPYLNRDPIISSQQPPSGF